MSKFPYPAIKGMICPLITPLNESGVDERGARKLIGHVLGERETPYVDALFCNGLTGEFPYLDLEQQKRMLGITVNQCNNQIPVLFGASGESEEGTIELCEYGEEHDADGVVVAPFYFHRSNRGLPQIMQRIAGSVEIPIYLYNNPVLARIGPRGRERNIRTHIFKRILLENENVWGIKDSSGDKKRFENYCRAARHKPGARVFMGDERQMIESLNNVPSFANLDPKTCRQLYNDCLDLEGGRKFAIQNYIREAGEIIYCGYQKVRGGLKYALSRMGISGEPVFEPYQTLTREEKETIRGFMMREYNLSP